MDSRSIFIEVEPLILKYARYCSGYDLFSAAKKLRMKEEKLQNLEEQKQKISLGQLKKFSTQYKISIAYFLLKKAPKDLVVPKDFRIVYSSEEDTLSHEVMMAIRKARYVQSVIQDLQAPEIKYTFKTVSLDDKPAEVAEYFRSFLDISIENQKKWTNSNIALRAWKESVEKLGIFVLQENLSKEDISAFCLADEKPYTITLNSFEHGNRRIFSLFHEIGHILLHGSGICTVDNFSRNSFGYIKIEKFCNQFAASALVPNSDFNSNEVVNRLKNSSFENWNTQDIRSLASLYCVSQEVIYRRFLTIGKITEPQYEQKRGELLRAYEEFKNRPKKSVPIPQYRKIISKNGRAFSSMILESLYSRKITLSDAADYLGTNTRHVFEVASHI